MRVVVQSINGGASVDLDLDPDSTFADLKTACADHWVLPPLFQELAVRAARPSDGEPLRAYGHIDEVLTVTLILSLASLEDPREDVRFEALQALDAVAQVGKGQRGERQHLVAAVRACLEDPLPDTRRLALKVLGEVTEPGDAGVMAAACVLLGSDGEPRVLCAALELLSRAGLGSEATTKAVSACVRRASSAHGEEVTFAAVRALCAVAKKGDENAIAALCDSLEEQNYHMRLLILDAMPQMADRGDGCAVSAVSRRLKDRDVSVRRKAVEILPMLAEKGHEASILALIACLHDTNLGVRCAALTGLIAVAPQGHAAAVGAAIGASADEDADVRCVALEVLSELASPGDEAALATVRAHLVDEDCDVVEMAEEALRKLTLA